MSSKNKSLNPHQLQLRVFSSVGGGIVKARPDARADSYSLVMDKSDRWSSDEDEKIYKAIADRYFEAKA